MRLRPEDAHRRTRLPRARSGVRVTLRFVDRHQNGFQRLGKPCSDETKRKISEAKLRDDADASAIHMWLNRWHPKTGVCEECDRKARTDYAYRHHPKPYTRNRDDYRDAVSQAALPAIAILVESPKAHIANTGALSTGTPARCPLSARA